MAKRRLTRRQQRYAEQAMALVPGAIAGFLRRHPCMRKDARKCDLTGAAQVAVVQASFRFDPSRGSMATYYGKAITHELRREVRRYRKHSQATGYSQPFEAVAASQLTDAQDSSPLLRALVEMPLFDRTLIQDRVISRVTIAALARSAGVDPRTLAKRLRKALDELARRADDLP